MNTDLDPENKSTIQSGITRRTFIKRTTATAVVTALALNAFRNEARAEGGYSAGWVLVSKTYYINPAVVIGTPAPIIVIQYPPATYPSITAIVAPANQHAPNPVEYKEWGFAHTDVKPGEKPYPRVTGAIETVIPANPNANPPVPAHSEWRFGPVVTITFCYVTQTP